jgi:Spy/CpxP family protein refolding chaperone
LRSQFQGGQGRREDFQNLSEEERQARFEEFRKQAEERMKVAREKLEQILLPEQMERLKQIGIQVQGTRALEDPQVAEALGLTEDQKQQLEKIREEIRAEFQRRFEEAQAQGQGQGPPQFDPAQFEAQRKANDERLLAVLTDEQKAKFEELKGEKFELDMSQFQFGRGRGGRGRGGPRGGQPQPDAPAPQQQ